MTTLDLRYFNTDTGKWEAPLANNSDLLALSTSLSTHVNNQDIHLQPGEHKLIHDSFQQSHIRYVGDINNLQIPGIYAIGDESINIPGTHGAGGYGVLTVTISEDVIIQQYVEYNSSGSYYRTLYSALSGVWMPWFRLTTDDDLKYHVEQTATNGMKPHGIGTAAAQDFASGSWTPSLRFGNVIPNGQTINEQMTYGNYVRIGNIVTINGLVAITNKGDEITGTAGIHGLPFGGNQGYSIVTARYENMNGESMKNRYPSGLVLYDYIRLDSFNVEESTIYLTNSLDYTNNSLIFVSGSYTIY